MKEAKWSKALLIVSLVFLTGAFVLYSSSGDNLSEVEANIVKAIKFAQISYDNISKEIDSFSKKAVAAPSEESLAAAQAEFEQNMISMSKNTRLQVEYVDGSMNSRDVKEKTGVNAKSTVERTDDLALKLMIESRALVSPGSFSADTKRIASVTNAMQKTFNESKQRQVTALAEMVKENVNPKIAKQITDSMPEDWNSLGKAVALDEKASKKALAKAEKEEKKVAKETRKQAEAAEQGFPAQAKDAQENPPANAYSTTAAAQAKMQQQAQSQPNATAWASVPSPAQPSVATSQPRPKPSLAINPQIPNQAQHSSDTSLKLDVIDELFMAYRDGHMPTEEDSPAEIWDKMRWMLKMGFDSRALDCLDGYREAYLLESGSEELDKSMEFMVSAAKKFIKEMHDLDVSGGVLVSSIIRQDVAEGDEASGLESYRVGDIITSVGTNNCCSVDELTANYAEGEPIKLYYYLQDSGVLTNMTQEASGQDLVETYQFREISK